MRSMPDAIFLKVANGTLIIGVVTMLHTEIAVFEIDV
jgi:hypothetical protein